MLRDRKHCIAFHFDIMIRSNLATEFEAEFNSNKSVLLFVFVKWENLFNKFSFREIFLLMMILSLMVAAGDSFERNYDVEMHGSNSARALRPGNKMFLNNHFRCTRTNRISK